MREVKRDRMAGSTIVDRVVNFFDPVRGARRMHARMTMQAAGGYYSGDRQRRPFNNWGVTSGDADAETLLQLHYLRSDSRDLLRKSPLALGAVNTVVTNVVGSGLTPHATPDSALLKEKAKVDDAAIEKFTAAAEREWDMWACSTSADASRRLKFGAIQELAFRSVLESGDIILLRRMIARKGVPLQFCLQLIEADRLDNPYRQADNKDRAGGIDHNEYGEPTFYNVLKAHPGSLWVNPDMFTTEKLPAYLPTGEWNVLHLFRQLRPQQTRGVPYLSPVIQALKELTQYSEAEIKNAVVSSLFSVFVKTDGGGGLPSSTDSNKKNQIELGAGSIIDLAPGESVEFANPGRPSGNFDPFFQAIVRQIGVALELPFEVLIKHFTASYSAAQAALLEAWRFFNVRRRWLGEYLCDPVREAVLSEAVARGRIVAPGFFSDPAIKAAWLGCEWTGAPRGSIDPSKEVAAAEIYEDRGWKTAEEITAELTGGDFDAKHQRRLKERDMRNELGPPPVFERPVPSPTTDTPQQENPTNDQPEKN
jgi:lambda family phage portal protein